MFTNTEIITVFRKKTDFASRLPVWEKVNFRNVYWEEISGEFGENKGMFENDSIFCVIPEESLTDCPPCKDDLIIVGNADNKDKTFTITSVKNFCYGSENVRHIEVTAK